MIRFTYMLIALVITGCSSFYSTPPTPITPASGGIPYPGGYCYTDAEYMDAFNNIYNAIIENHDIPTGKGLMEQELEDMKCHSKLDGGISTFDYIYPDEDGILFKDGIVFKETRDRAKLAPIICYTNIFISYSGVHSPAANPLVGQWNEIVKVLCNKPVTYTYDIEYWGSYIEDPWRRSQRVSRSMGQAGVPAWTVITLVNGTFMGNAAYSYTWSNADSLLNAELNGISPISVGVKGLPDRVINKIGNQYPYWVGGPGRTDEVFWPARPYGAPNIRAGSAAWTRICMAEYQARGFTFVANTYPREHNNHHVKPVRWGGTNIGSNCYRLKSAPHADFSAFWWVGKFRTPIWQ